MKTRSLSLFLGACVGAAGAVAFLALPVLRGSQAEAQTPPAARQYRECIAVTTFHVTGREFNAGQMPRMSLQIPMGWTPVGGASDSTGEPYVILCR